MMSVQRNGSCDLRMLTLTTTSQVGVRTSISPLFPGWQRGSLIRRKIARKSFLVKENRHSARGYEGHDAHTATFATCVGTCVDGASWKRRAGTSSDSCHRPVCWRAELG